MGHGVAGGRSGARIEWEEESSHLSLQVVYGSYKRCNVGFHKEIGGSGIQCSRGHVGARQVANRNTTSGHNDRSISCFYRNGITGFFDTITGSYARNAAELGPCSAIPTNEQGSVTIPDQSTRTSGRNIVCNFEDFTSSIDNDNIVCRSSDTSSESGAIHVNVTTGHAREIRFQTQYIGLEIQTGEGVFDCIGYGLGRGQTSNSSRNFRSYISAFCVVGQSSNDQRIYFRCVLEISDSSFDSGGHLRSGLQAGNSSVNRGSLCGWGNVGAGKITDRNATSRDHDRSVSRFYRNYIAHFFQTVTSGETYQTTEFSPVGAVPAVEVFGIAIPRQSARTCDRNIVGNGSDFTSGIDNDNITGFGGNAAGEQRTVNVNVATGNVGENTLNAENVFLEIEARQSVVDCALHFGAGNQIGNSGRNCRVNIGGLCVWDQRSGQVFGANTATNFNGVSAVVKFQRFGNGVVPNARFNQTTTSRIGGQFFQFEVKDFANDAQVTIDLCHVLKPLFYAGR
uniref:Uncharacterized protein n=1 Tax=Myoviridae sp. ctshb19 TaxID=2825194 RepID=A0A8S5UH14_9CAUD|nr:MAG TPA: hypothetical protein [Myoviridae sp. ctshb19]